VNSSWSEFGHTFARWLPVLVLIVWSLWGTNWRRLWPVLAEGGWIPLVLIGIMAAAVWAFVFPKNVIVLGFMPVANGLWQFGAVTLMICLSLACGWLQGRMNWYPPEISFDPPPPVHDPHHSAH
jgi:hypothetical protein